jgi:hypothetical protein
MSAKNYRVTIKKAEGYWLIKTYTLFLRPIYDHGNPEPVRIDEEWEEDYHDVALFYWEARFMAWLIKRKLEKNLPPEEVIYERKG